MRPDGPRDPVAGPEAGPEQPYPIRLSGPVIKGFGRGSKEVCIPSDLSRFLLSFFVSLVGLLLESICTRIHTHIYIYIQPDEWLREDTKNVQNHMIPRT